MAEWAATEARAAGTPAGEPDLAAIDRVLAPPSATGPALRWLASALVRAAGSGGSADLAGRLGRLQQTWEAHERLVPARVTWLGWAALARIAGGDALMLARARDRMLERLHEQGLDRAVDLPGFLRHGATPTGERARIVGDHLRTLHESAVAWIGRDLFNARDTRPIADLIFAFGLARLGAPAASGQLHAQGLAGLDRQDAVASWAARAFGFRVRRALEVEADPPRPCPPELVRSPGNARPRFSGTRSTASASTRAILEPHERINPYRHWHGKLADDVVRELARVVDVDRPRLNSPSGWAYLLTLKAEGHRPELQDARVLGTALEVGYRLGEAFAAGRAGARPADRRPTCKDVAPARLAPGAGACAWRRTSTGRATSAAFVGALVGLVEASGENLRRGDRTGPPAVVSGLAQAGDAG